MALHRITPWPYRRRTLLELSDTIIGSIALIYWRTRAGIICCNGCDWCWWNIHALIRWFLQNVLIKMFTWVEQSSVPCVFDMSLMLWVGSWIVGTNISSNLLFFPLHCFLLKCFQQSFLVVKRYFLQTSHQFAADIKYLLVLGNAANSSSKYWYRFKKTPRRNLYALNVVEFDRYALIAARSIN